MLQRVYPTGFAFVLLVLFTASVPLFVACGDDGGDDGGGDETNNDTNNDTRAQGVRMFYASEPAPVTVVFRSDTDGVDDVTIASVAKNAVSAYQPLAAGAWRAVLLGSDGVPTGLTVDGINVTDSSVTTLTVVDNRDGDPQKQIIADTATSPGENQGSIRILYEANGGAVDIYNLADGLRVGTAVGFGEQVPYLTLPTGTYEFEVRKEGLDEVLLNIPNVQLPPGQVSTLFVFGDSDPNGDGDTSDSTLAHTLAADQSF